MSGTNAPGEKVRSSPRARLWGQRGSGFRQARQQTEGKGQCHPWPMWHPGAY